MPARAGKVGSFGTVELENVLESHGAGSQPPPWGSEIRITSSRSPSGRALPKGEFSAPLKLPTYGGCLVSLVLPRPPRFAELLAQQGLEGRMQSRQVLIAEEETGAHEKPTFLAVSGVRHLEAIQDPRAPPDERQHLRNGLITFHWTKRTQALLRQFERWRPELSVSDEGDHALRRRFAGCCFGRGRRNRRCVYGSSPRCRRRLPRLLCGHANLGATGRSREEMSDPDQGTRSHPLGIRRHTAIFPLAGQLPEGMPAGGRAAQTQTSTTPRCRPRPRAPRSAHALLGPRGSQVDPSGPSPAANRSRCGARLLLGPSIQKGRSWLERTSLSACAPSPPGSNRQSALPARCFRRRPCPKDTRRAGRQDPSGSPRFGAVGDPAARRAVARRIPQNRHQGRPATTSSSSVSCCFAMSTRPASSAASASRTRFATLLHNDGIRPLSIDIASPPSPA